MNDVSSGRTHSRAIYPGTFDPITNGHTELVARAARMFEHITVAVAESAGKGPMFSIDERVALARDVLSVYDNVSVIGFRKLLVHCMRELETNVIIRGLRAVSDFEYEFQLAAMNRRLDPGVETVFLTPSEDYTFVSASLIREIARLDGDVSPFVDPKVLVAINSKLER